MKKIGLLLVTTIFLSGCSATNGILSEQDIIDAMKEDSTQIIEKQNEVSYVHDDVKEFLKQIRKASDSVDEESYGHFAMILENSGDTEKSEFLKEIYIDHNMDNVSKKEYEELVDILDETIAKGIKLYLDKNIDADLEDSGMSTKIGRVWVSINPAEVYDETHEYQGSTGQLDKGLATPDKGLGVENSKNEIGLTMKLRDIKNPDYERIVEKIEDEDLILDNIKIGKNQDLIQLSNMDFKHYSYNGYSKFKSAINCYLFMKDQEIDKIRMSITGQSDKDIDNNLKSLSRISNVLEFNLEDNKKLEEISTLAKENKIGKKTLSSERFNFRYRNTESERHIYNTPEKINTAEITIEKIKDK